MSKQDSNDVFKSKTEHATTPRQSSERQYDESSPPRTPPAQIGRPGKLRGVASAQRTRPSLQDAFGDELREGRNLHNRHRSNSHDLSWSPGNARGSVVDNMLLSLDKFGFASGSSRATPTYAEDTQCASVQRFALSNGRPRGHTTSSSISSDYSFHAETPASPKQTRGHRSNSSSNFQSSLGRIDSVRLAGNDNEKEVDGYKDKSFVTPGGSKKASKSSAFSSLDYGQGIGGGLSTSQQQPHSRRSASFDSGYKRPGAPGNAMGSTVNQNSYTIGDFEAAPTPTVPGGPRKEYSPSRPAGFRPSSSLSSAQTQPARRRGSIRTPMAIFSRNDRLDVPSEASGNQGASELAKSISHSTASSVPDPTTPNRNYMYPAVITTSVSASKENQKPGFFKRVFGSSKGTSNSNTNGSFSKKQAYSQKNTQAAGRVSSFPSENIINGTSTTPSPQQAQSAEKPSTKNKISSKETPTLNKKTSFFRRRRKSIQDPAPVPVPSQTIAAPHGQYEDAQNLMPPEKYNMGTHPDSPSSLRRVMDPYLDNHRRLESINSVDTYDSGRGTRLIPKTTAYSTIRTVTTTNTVASPKTTVTSTTKSLMPTETEISPTTTIRGANLRRFSSAEDKAASRRASTERNEEGKFQRSPSHTRTQSDIDKNLPRLPVDYNATISEIKREVSKVESDQAEQKSPTQDVSTADPKSNFNKFSEALRSVPDRSSNWQQHDVAAKAEEATTYELTTRASNSTTGDYKSASSKLTSPEVEEPQVTQDADLADETLEAIRFPSTDPSEPLPEHRAFAEKLFSGNSNIDKTETAPWLGEAGADRAKFRRAYMELFDWKDMSVLAALRAFCSSVQLKGETQQVDRVLDAISTRWCDCNPNHGFKATDVVHTICYSLLLLNTDLHLADIESKMTRNQFIKNTMPTIRRVVADAAPNAFDNARASYLPPPNRPQTLGSQPSTNSRFSTISSEASEPSDFSRPTYRLSTRPSDHSGSESVTAEDECGPLVKTPFTGKLNSWELQVEVVLKNFYNSIRQYRLPLSGGEEQRPALENPPSSTSLSAVTGGMLRRTNSLLSKAGSETFPVRGRMMESKTGSRWSSKARSRPRLYPASMAQSRTSVDEDQSAASPSMSSMWSKYSLGRTQTSMSANSFGSDFPLGDYQRSIGFANALSQAIIRDDPAADSTEELVRVGPLLEDESLELEGAPWAKEGNLKHKHHLEAIDKRAKDRSWSECFTVIEKGWIKMFQFNVNARSLRQKARNRGNVGGVVGGGNWMENAQSLGQFLLRHTIASSLPPPGYSKARPHVWALSLPTGAVHLFQAGTPEIVKEFVSTANYWSARLSKEPLVGGVSNMEYGWSERVINMALVNDSRPSSTLPGPRPSFQASIRSSIDQNSSRPKLPGDRVLISEWTPPTQSMAASQLLEVDQLRALSTYVKNVEEELRKHNELRGPMLLAFTTRHPNYNKAMNNWERKSAYLLREIVKFTTYLESLHFAQKEKDKVLGEREQRERMREASIDGGRV